MKPLIRNQRIRIDSHQWGDGRPMDISSVHIHKSTKQPIPVDGRRQHVEIEIPIVGDQLPHICGGNEELNKIPREIREEIEYVLSHDNKKVKEFAIEVADVLSQYGGKEWGQEKVVDALNRIAKSVGLSWTKEYYHSIFDGLWDNVHHLQLRDTEDNLLYCLTLNNRGLQIEQTNHDSVVDYRSPRYIIANIGAGSKGKSTTIKSVFKILSNKYPNDVNILAGKSEKEDIKATIKIGNVLVGVESQGDPWSRMSDSMEDFEQLGCQIIITASRTRSDTYNQLFDMRYWYNYEIIIANNPRTYYHNPMFGKQLLGDWDERHAQEIVSIVEDLIVQLQSGNNYGNLYEL